MSDQNRNAPPLNRAESHPLALPSYASPQGVASKVLTASEREGEPAQKAGETQASVHTARPRMISERKLLANRANAKKSTGPRTERGKACSSRNAVTHGLFCKKGLFAPDGAPIDPELRAMWARLQGEYGTDNVGDQLLQLLQTIVVEWSHQKRASELEEQCWLKAIEDPPSSVNLSKLHRYRTTNQRSLLKHLSRLYRQPRTTR